MTFSSSLNRESISGDHLRVGEGGAGVRTFPVFRKPGIRPSASVRSWSTRHPYRRCACAIGVAYAPEGGDENGKDQHGEGNLEGEEEGDFPIGEGGMHVANQPTAGDNLHTIYEFQKFMAANAVSFVEPDVTNCGGITPWMKVAHLAEAYNLPVTSHGVHDLHVHLLAAIPNATTSKSTALASSPTSKYRCPLSTAWRAPRNAPATAWILSGISWSPIGSDEAAS